MKTIDFYENIIIIKEILPNNNNIFNLIKENTVWDLSISSRKTCSYGKPYNYSNINYTHTIFPSYIKAMSNVVEKMFNFSPNNCLINYYDKSNSKMGFHSDQIDLLVENSGIAIFSLGDKRILRFKNKLNSNEIIDITLEENSLFFMSKNIQKYWLHALLKSDNSLNQRISVTFRQLI
jgi:alkylated DNA repair dioxygenase AlkB